MVEVNKGFQGLKHIAELITSDTQFADYGIFRPFLLILKLFKWDVIKAQQRCIYQLAMRK